MIVLTDRLRQVRDTARSLAHDPIQSWAAELDRAGEFSREVESLFWKNGLLTLILPPTHGGLGDKRCTGLCLAVEEIAKVCASSALMMIIQAVGSFPILHGGSEETRRRALPRLSEGQELAAYLATEPGAGSDVAAIRTTAERHGSDYIINGTKCWATNGGVASMVSVLARTGPERTKGLSFFVVDRETPGLRVSRTEKKLGQRSSNTAELVLEDVRVPASSLLGNEGDGFKIAMADFDMSRPAIAAQALGIAQGALGCAIDELRERGVEADQLTQAFVAEAAAQVEAGRGLVYRAAELHDAGERNTRYASMAKFFCGDAAVKITQGALDVLGPEGCEMGHPAERMFRDAKLTQIFEGTNQIQRIVVARDILRRGLEPDQSGS